MNFGKKCGEKWRIILFTAFTAITAFLTKIHPKTSTPDRQKYFIEQYPLRHFDGSYDNKYCERKIFHSTEGYKNFHRNDHFFQSEVVESLNIF